MVAESLCMTVKQWIVGIVSGLDSPDRLNFVTPLIPTQTSTTQPIETNYINGTSNLTDTDSSCTQTLSIAHSTVSYSPPFGQPSTTQPPFPGGTTAKISCESGWRLDGVISTSVCQAGNWSPDSNGLSHCVVWFKHQHEHDLNALLSGWRYLSNLWSPIFVNSWSSSPFVSINRISFYYTPQH